MDTVIYRNHGAPLLIGTRSPHSSDESEEELQDLQNIVSWRLAFPSRYSTLEEVQRVWVVLLHFHFFSLFYSFSLFLLHFLLHHFSDVRIVDDDEPRDERGGAIWGNATIFKWNTNTPSYESPFDSVTLSMYPSYLHHYHSPITIPLH